MKIGYVEVRNIDPRNKRQPLTNCQPYRKIIKRYNMIIDRENFPVIETINWIKRNGTLSFSNHEFILADGLKLNETRIEISFFLSSEGEKKLWDKYPNISNKNAFWL